MPEYSHFTRAYLADRLPVAFTRFEGGAPPPALDAAVALVPDLRRSLAHLGRTAHHGDDRLAGFVRVDGPALRPLTRSEVVEIVVEVLERLEREIRTARVGSTDALEAVSVARALRVWRDTVARGSRASGTLLGHLADRLVDEDLADEQEDAAEAWVSSLPRERFRRSDVGRMYRAAGAPGGLSRNEVLALVRATYGEHVETRVGSEGYVIDLRRTLKGAPL